MNRFFRAILASMILAALSNGGGQCVLAQVTTIEDTNTGIIYSGSWSTVSYASASGGTMHRSSNGTSAVGSFFQYTFTGTQIEFYGAKSNHSGAFDVYLDGVKVASIANQFSSQDQWKVLLWSSGVLANTSHTVKFVVTSNPDWAFLDFFKVTGAVGANTPPTVSITSPANGATFNPSSSIVVNASAADTSPGTVSSVQFLSGTTSLGTDNTNPYSVTWANVAAGTYSLTAKATDNGAAVTTSSVVKVIVNSTTSSGGGGGACGNVLGGEPTDNPVATKYGSTAYPWTANIKWNCVYNINKYSGADNVAKFNAARDAAAAAGGGVVYFPAGDYSFTGNLVLKNGVVIRGASTTSNAKSGTSAGTLDPATNFVFPDREHKGIYNNTGTDANMGVVNIDSDGGAIMLWPELVTSGTTLKSYWWTATDIRGMGSNKLVLGNRIRNVSYKWPNPDSTSGNIWPWRFSTAVACYSDANCLVANNLIGQASRTATSSVNFSSNQGCTAFSGNAPYAYDNRYGIDVNRVLLGGVIGAYNTAGKANSRALNPTSFPWQFRRGLAIRDNYVYMNGRVGIIWSGNGDGSTKGSGTQVLSNHVQVASGTSLYSADGARCAGGQSTNENRGYDQEGWSSRVDGNTGAINRQSAYNTAYMTTDGEGVLHQDTNGNTGFQDIWNANNLTHGATGYMAYYKLSSVTQCTITANSVKSTEYLGTVLHANGTSLSGNVCSGNSEGCQNF